MNRRRSVLRHVGGAALVAIVAACGGEEPRVADDAPTKATTAETTLSEVTTTDGPTTNTATPVSSDEATTTMPSEIAPSETAPVETAPLETSAASTTAAPTTVPIPCDGTDGTISTRSGRAVTLRTTGIGIAAPTILVIHGFTGTPAGIERIADLTDVANTAGIAVAYPEGTEVSPGGFGWDTGAAVFATSGVDDVAAISEMIDAIVATGCVDRDAITITGESNGAGMTLAALCAPTLAGAFRSAVMVIPAIDDGVLERCGGNGAPDTPLAAVIGLIDTTAPVDGGNGLLPQHIWFDEVATWRGCGPVQALGAMTPLVDQAAGTDCRSCTEILTVADGPHTWPGTPLGNGGSTPGTFDLNRRIIADALAAEPGCLSER